MLQLILKFRFSGYLINTGISLPAEGFLLYFINIIGQGRLKQDLRYLLFTNQDKNRKDLFSN